MMTGFFAAARVLLYACLPLIRSSITEDDAPERKSQLGDVCMHTRTEGGVVVGEGYGRADVRDVDVVVDVSLADAGIHQGRLIAGVRSDLCERV